ncbi:hypothetical protein MTBPR1_20182 [Candidatus Terasakiella magnetica]|uniref:Uncharacterized protein n=1 Tax=Candidatus Terasakiella magnetica TaxID=1867952 RepID=A0A1C3RGK6_9PROT|nr:hypothetical protein MTBPR1_20182 [Candidatus Terasakiella magnetica]
MNRTNWFDLVNLFLNRLVFSGFLLSIGQMDHIVICSFISLIILRIWVKHIAMIAVFFITILAAQDIAQTKKNKDGNQCQQNEIKIGHIKSLNLLSFHI